MEKVNKMLRENQCGFLRGRVCADQLFALCILMKRAREFHQPLFLCFVELKKAIMIQQIVRQLGSTGVKIWFPTQSSEHFESSS